MVEKIYQQSAVY